MTLYPYIMPIQAVIDLALILIIVYLLFFRRKQDEKRLRTYMDSLRKAIRESDHATAEFRDALGRDMESFKNLVALQDEKRAQIRELIKKSNEAAVRLGSELRESEIRKTQMVRSVATETVVGAQRTSPEQYRQVIELSSRGFSADEIGRATGLSPQEIQLVLDIRK